MERIITNRIWKLFFVVQILISVSGAEDRVLILRPEGEGFSEAAEGVKTGLSTELFNVSERVFIEKIGSKTVYKAIKEVQPRILVLMDNGLIRKYSAVKDRYNLTIPAVSVMAVFVSDEISDEKNMAAVSYEMPVVTPVVDLRYITEESIKKVGILHREFMGDFVEKNREFCSQEEIEICSYSLPSDYRNRDIKKGLDSLIKDAEIDVLWIPNDNVILTVETLKRYWIPYVKRYSVPVIAGIETLISSDMNFGAFGALPDHFEIGKQAAELIYNVRQSNWKFEENIVEPPLSIYKLLNKELAEDYLGIKKKRLPSIDRIIE